MEFDRLGVERELSVGVDIGNRGVVEGLIVGIGIVEQAVELQLVLILADHIVQSDAGEGVEQLECIGVEVVKGFLKLFFFVVPVFEQTGFLQIRDQIRVDERGVRVVQVIEDIFSDIFEQVEQDGQPADQRVIRV